MILFIHHFILETLELQHTSYTFCTQLQYDAVCSRVHILVWWMLVLCAACVTYHTICTVICYTTFMIIILLNSSLCSLSTTIHVQKTGDTAPSPFHLHKFWNSLDVVILQVSIAVHQAVSFCNVQSCIVLYDTQNGAAVCCRPFLMNTEWDLQVKRGS
jgi:hypothetical protein